MSKSSMILFPQELKNIKFQGIYEATIEENIVYINAYVNEFNLSDRWVTIGRYNLDNKEGKILLEGYKDYKWYKNLKSLWNAIWRFDSNACMTDINVIKNKIKEMQKQSKTENVEVKVIASIKDTETIDTVKDDITIENNTTTLETPETKTSHDVLQEIYDIDAKLDILDDEYSSIQANRKSKGLSLAIYKCSDSEALQLVEIDNKMKSLEKLQDDLQQQRKQLSNKEYYIKSNKLVKEYDNKKYKVVINYNETIFTDNFHEVVNKYIDNNKIKIQVFKLLYLNHEKYLPHEINIYNKFMNQWDLLEENRYYYTNDNYLLEKQLYYNNTLINKFVYRGFSDVTAYIYKTNKEQIEYNMFAHINNIKQNYGIEIYKENNNITCLTNTNIALGDYIKGLTSRGQELLNKIKHKYSKDKYININELIAV
jgi:hypothetical protein